MKYQILEEVFYQNKILKKNEIVEIKNNETEKELLTFLEFLTVFNLSKKLNEEVKNETKDLKDLKNIKRINN